MIARIFFSLNKFCFLHMRIKTYARERDGIDCKAFLFYMCIEHLSVSQCVFISALWYYTDWCSGERASLLYKMAKINSQHLYSSLRNFFQFFFVQLSEKKYKHKYFMCTFFSQLQIVNFSQFDLLEMWSK